MSWVGIQAAGIEFTFTKKGDENVSLSGSSAFTDSGTPVPSIALGSGWGLVFAGVEGRAPLRLRVTAVAFQSNWQDGTDPSRVAIEGGAFFENGSEPDGWSPTPMEFNIEFAGDDVELTNWSIGEFAAQTSQFLIEVWQDAPAACEEIGRVTRNFVSAHQRDRVHYSSLYAPEMRCLVTNFNGAIPPGRTIASATWQTWDTTVVVMSAPKVQARSVEVMIRAQYTGRARILVTATLDNGEVYTAWHVVRVNPAPYFDGSQYWQPGPQRLEASAA